MEKRFATVVKKNTELDIGTNQKTEIDKTNKMEKIMALSWKEPFASLMLCGKIETRTWKTNHRGLILICASKSPYSVDDLLAICDDVQLHRIHKALSNNAMGSTLGKAIAVGELIDCVPMQKEHENDCFVRFNPALYCHIYKNVRAIEPFDWKGSQGWKQLTQEEKNKIKFL